METTAQKQFHDVLAWFMNVATSVVIVFVNKVRCYTANDVSTWLAVLSRGLVAPSDAWMQALAASTTRGRLTRRFGAALQPSALTAGGHLTQPSQALMDGKKGHAFTFGG